MFLVGDHCEGHWKREISVKIMMIYVGALKIATHFHEYEAEHTRTTEQPSIYIIANPYIDTLTKWATCTLSLRLKDFVLDHDCASTSHQPAQTSYSQLNLLLPVIKEWKY
jgi:hypothetical protein